MGGVPALRTGARTSGSPSGATGSPSEGSGSRSDTDIAGIGMLSEAARGRGADVPGVASLKLTWEAFGRMGEVTQSSSCPSGSELSMRDIPRLIVWRTLSDGLAWPASPGSLRAPGWRPLCVLLRAIGACCGAASACAAASPSHVAGMLPSRSRMDAPRCMLILRGLKDFIGPDAISADIAAAQISSRRS